MQEKGDTMHQRHRIAAAVAGCLLALGLGGCGSDEPATTSGSPPASPPPSTPAQPEPLTAITEDMLLPPDSMTEWNGTVTWQQGTAADAAWTTPALLPDPVDLGAVATLTRGYTTDAAAPPGEAMRGVNEVWLFPDRTTALAAFAAAEDALIPDWDVPDGQWRVPFDNRLRGLVSWSRSTECLPGDEGFCAASQSVRFEFAGLVSVDNAISVVGFSANWPDANWCDPVKLEQGTTCAMQDPQLPSLLTAKALLG